MTKNLFLEGPIQTGKSTLIRAKISEYLPDSSNLGGFTSQRLVSPLNNLETVAFRITDANAPVTTDIRNILNSWPNFTKKECIEKGIFKLFADYDESEGLSKKFRVLNYPEVFEGVALDYITRINCETQLILLDEIGGHELAVPLYKEALFNLLRSDVPCIGVIKHPESTRRMDSRLLHHNAELHDEIMKSGGEILYFDRSEEYTSNVAEKVSDFVKKAASHNTCTAY